MIGFARFINFYGILVALAKKHTKVKLSVWETASQWLHSGERANICLNLSFCHFSLASLCIALIYHFKLEDEKRWHKNICPNSLKAIRWKIVKHEFNRGLKDEVKVQV